MTLVWVTGVSGSGKSTVCAELNRRGYTAFDADEGFCRWVDTRSGAVIESVPMADGGWEGHIDWVLVPDRVAALRDREGITFLCGSVSNEGQVWDLFDRVIALVVDDEVVRSRLATRTGNAFGVRPAELAAVLSWNARARQTYEGFGATIVDADVPVDRVVEAVLAAAQASEVEQPLPGGNVGGAVRVGGTVRRRTGPWTPAVHDLLGHLDAAGLDAIPRVHGIDASGREILDFLPGTVPAEPDHLTDAQLVATGRWLARFHAASAGFPAAERRWYFATSGPTEGQVICHNDVAPYNLVFDGDDLVGVFDWDLASPGHPWDDVAFLAWNAVPLLRVREDLDAAAVARRLRLLVTAYGDAALTEREVLDRAIARMESGSDSMEAAQREGDEGMLALARIGEPAATRARIADARSRLPAIMAALG